MLTSCSPNPDIVTLAAKSDVKIVQYETAILASYKPGDEPQATAQMPYKNQWQHGQHGFHAAVAHINEPLTHELG